MAVDKMEQSHEFDLSMLGTNVHHHYTGLGWEQVSQPKPVITNWQSIDEIPKVVELHLASASLADSAQCLLEIHANQPRRFQIDRSPVTIFQQWVRWEWENAAAILHVEECEGQQGYVAISQLDSETAVGVLEWRTPNLDLEKKLLCLAAAEIRRRHGQTTPIRLHTLPQFMTVDQLGAWAGCVSIEVNSDTMLRNIRLPDDCYHRIKEALSTGRATHWTGDFF